MFITQWHCKLMRSMGKGRQAAAAPPLHMHFQISCRLLHFSPLVDSKLTLFSLHYIQ